MTPSCTVSAIFPYLRLTACDLEKSFVFEQTVEITSYVLFTRIVDKTYYISRGIWVRKVSNSKSDLQCQSVTGNSAVR